MMERRLLRSAGRRIQDDKRSKIPIKDGLNTLGVDVDRSLMAGISGPDVEQFVVLNPSL